MTNYSIQKNNYKSLIEKGLKPQNETTFVLKGFGPKISGTEMNCEHGKFSEGEVYKP